MSNIPSSAMPHAKASEGSEKESQQEQGGGPTIAERAGKLREQAGDYARENPKTAIAAGAALAAGVIAAAAIPLVRGRSGSGASKKDGAAAKKTATADKTTTGAKKS
ncbi:MAG TPA: hypothetical protein VE891_02170 [Allosphingosinicella sp.]|nr:hypothetical protein [Allosphingosinicella sp.]